MVDRSGGKIFGKFVIDDAIPLISCRFSKLLCK
jgi:hypothetical protein